MISLKTTVLSSTRRGSSASMVRAPPSLRRGLVLRDRDMREAVSLGEIVGLPGNRRRGDRITGANSRRVERSQCNTKLARFAILVEQDVFSSGNTTKSFRASYARIDWKYSGFQAAGSQVGWRSRVFSHFFLPMVVWGWLQWLESRCFPWTKGQFITDRCFCRRLV